jgi:hypothetical protein
MRNILVYEGRKTFGLLLDRMKERKKKEERK